MKTNRVSTLKDAGSVFLACRFHYPCVNFPVSAAKVDKSSQMLCAIAKF